MATSKKKRKRKKHKWDPQKLEQMRQKRKIRGLFMRIGFEQIKANGIEFTFDGRTGEIDEIFRFENVLVLCEYTTGKNITEHVAKKSILYSKINDNQAQWAEEYSVVNGDFNDSIKDCGYTFKQLRVRILYVSTDTVSKEISNALQYVQFFNGTRARYFDALSHTIHKSSRHEFFKYLGLDYSEIGDEINNPGGVHKNFAGHLLPEGHSTYPQGFKVVSFYADPKTLLALSYVLRQDSWRDNEGLYQRILIKSKIAKMRRYLVTEKRVFVNNIIVTLPPTTSINEPGNPGKNIDPTKLDNIAQVSIGVPYRADVIGLVDGQHRVFCYYEGSDTLEPQIEKYRVRQNLLVTGLIFPQSWSEAKKREFEAQLFLEINDNQAKARSALKQSIELILSPFSTIAISKEIINRLASKGPLHSLVQISFFDPPEMIKTTSIVSYGLRPLVKFEGNDSLFDAWSESAKSKLPNKGTPISDRRILLERYLTFCVDSINSFMIAAKLESDPDKWKRTTDRKSMFLTPTVVNGLLVCMRRLVEAGKLSTTERYQKKLKGLETFKFKNYKSSGWRAMGDDIYQTYFA